MKKIYVTGVSGIGKTTIAKELENRGVHSISIDEAPGLCSWVNKKSGDKVKYRAKLNKKFIGTHDWICDTQNLEKLMNEGDSLVVVLGSASNQKDYLYLFDKILLLQCKPDTFIKRIENRTDHDFGKDKTAQDSILGWYEHFESEMLEKGAISIDAEKPIEEVVKQIIEQTNL